MGDGQGVECAKQRNISEILAKVAACYDWTVANGVAGLGCCKVCTRFCAATMAVSADEVVGIEKPRGKKSTVRAIRSLQFCNIKMGWQW